MNHDASIPEPEALVLALRLSLLYTDTPVEAVRLRAHADVLAALAAHGRTPAGPLELVGRGDAVCVEVPLVGPSAADVAHANAIVEEWLRDDAPPALVRVTDGDAEGYAPDGPGDDAA